MRRRDIFKAGAGLGALALDVGVSARPGAVSVAAAPSITTMRTGSHGPLAPVSDFPQPFRSTYLNCAALALRSEPARRAFQDFGNGLAGGGTKFFFANLHVLQDAPRMAAARLYGTRPENIGFTSCVSETVSQFAWWLRPGRGKNVVSIDIECPATTLAWMRVAQETGAEIRLVSVWDDVAALSFERVAQLVDKNTVAICISHVQWVSGYRLDLKALADLAHAHGAILIVDAMHTAGVVPIDVHRDNVDVLVAGAYKWLCAYSGIAACYVRPDLMDRFDPILMGAQTNHPAPPYDDVESRRIELPKGPERWHYGSANQEARVAFAAGANYLADLGLARVESHALKLGSMLGEGLRKLGAVVVTPEDPAKRAGIITAKFPGRDGPKLSAALEDKGLYTSPRHGLIRFSCHVFNDEAGIEEALHIIGSVV